MPSHGVVPWFPKIQAPSYLLGNILERLDRHVYCRASFSDLTSTNRTNGRTSAGAPNLALQKKPQTPFLALKTTADLVKFHQETNNSKTQAIPSSLHTCGRRPCTQWCILMQRGSHFDLVSLFFNYRIPPLLDLSRRSTQTLTDRTSLSPAWEGPLGE